MNTSQKEKIKPSHLYELKNAPCRKCLIQSICSKSFMIKTACDKYEQFILKVIKQEKSREIKK